MEHTTCKDLSKLKVIELKAIAKSRGLRGYSKLLKYELIDFLESSEIERKERLEVKAEIIESIRVSIISNYHLMEDCRIIDLKAIAKSIGLRGYSKLRKAELIDFLKQSDLLKQREPFFRW